ncbi:MAG: ATP-binding cassette domain-containing protein [Clostridia bacterium]|nr:ATP-binding cassette domain-containing protein [Clostridia bacterium]
MLDIENISFSYKNSDGTDKSVIENLSLKLPKTGIYAIMGASGCGKTTLLEIISGLLIPRSGKIMLKTNDISFAFQDARLLPHKTAAENVNFVLGGNKKTIGKAIEALSELGLKEAAEKYPDELSGGMQKRVSLARAFVRGADIILLDEPFNGLDSEIKSTIIGKIKEIGKHSLVLLITHDLGDAEECADKILDFNELNKKGR